MNPAPAGQMKATFGSETRPYRIMDRSKILRAPVFVSLCAFVFLW